MYAFGLMGLPMRVYNCTPLCLRSLRCYFDCAMEVNRVTIKGSVEDITATDVDGAYY